MLKTLYMTVLLLGALTLNAAVPTKDSTEIYREQQDAVAVEEAQGTEGLAADHTPAPEASNNDTTSNNG